MYFAKTHIVIPIMPASSRDHMVCLIRNGFMKGMFS